MSIINFKISIIVATYNWPEALCMCIQSLLDQTDANYEIIIADDGSGPETKKVIAKFIETSNITITHLWQKDDGCRKTLIVNKGIEHSEGDYLIFIDGDCLVQPDFIAQHRRLSEKNCLITGSRALLSEELTKKLLGKKKWDYIDFKKNLIKNRIFRDINKFLQFFIKIGDSPLRNVKPFTWKRIKGCNLSCWKSDALSIKGFDESLVGWAHEDADFVFRLEHKGIRRKSGSWGTEVIHLHHPIRDQSLNDQSVKRLEAKIREMKMSINSINEKFQSNNR